MIRQFTIVLMLCLSANASLKAQLPDLDWVWHSIGISPVDIAVDDSGYVLAAGGFGGGDTLDFDPGPDSFFLLPADGRNIYVVKLDNFGNLVWAKKIGGWPAYGAINVLTDPVGNVYVQAHFFGPGDFNPGPDTFMITPSSFRHLVITKLDPQGDFIWAKGIDGDNLNTSSMSLDKAGNVYFTGYFKGYIDFDPGPDKYNLWNSRSTGEPFVSKWDSEGNFEWAKMMKGDENGDKFYGITEIKTGKDGDVFITGTFQGTVDFAPYMTGEFKFYSEDFSAFIGKLDSKGKVLWIKRMKTNDKTSFPFETFIAGMVLDEYGNIYLAGTLASTMDFDPGPGDHSLSAIGSEDAFVCKLDGDGDLIWVRQMGGSDASLAQVKYIALDKMGSVYSFGSFNGTVDFDPGMNSFPLNSNGSCHLFVSKLDASGNFAWAGQMPGNQLTCYNNNALFPIALDKDFNVYLAGYFYGSLDIDPGMEEFVIDHDSSSTFYDGFLLRLTPTLPPEVYLGPDTAFCSGDSLRLSTTLNQYAHLWNTTSTDTVIYANTSGTYYVEVTTPYGFLFDTIEVIVHPRPVVYVGPDTAFCGLFEYKVQASGDLVMKYAWNTGDTTSYTVANKAGDYLVQVADQFQCSNADTMVISALEKPQIRFSPDSVFCDEASLFLKAGPPGLEYHWSTGETTSGIYVNDTGWYSVEVSKPFCIKEDSIYIQRLCPSEPVIFIPNAFSPNQNGLNERFRPVLTEGVTHYSMEIYNRWGQLIFRTTNQDEGWDGTFMDDDCQQGIYMYQLHYRDIERPHAENGAVMLIR